MRSLPDGCGSARGGVIMFLLVSEGLLSESHEFLAFPVPGQDGEMGAGERVQAAPRARPQP